MVREATELGLAEAQAMAYADLGVICSLQGLQLEELEAKYQAFQAQSRSAAANAYPGRPRDRAFRIGRSRRRGSHFRS